MANVKKIEKEKKRMYVKKGQKDSVKVFVFACNCGINVR